MKSDFERLREVAETHFKNLSYLASMINKDRRIFYTYKNRHIGRKILKELEDVCKINPRFIQYGEEPMLLNDGTKNESNVSEVNNVELISLPDIRTLTIEQMKELKERIDDYSKKIEKILEAAEN